MQVRPRDIKTLERAQSLLAAPAADAYRARAAAEGELAAVVARVSELKQRQRSAQLAEREGHALLQRQRLEERILDDELAAIA